jgi:predicted short-subunit dehydrogenase-like oxidoreductase (DUF2520 family)
MPTTTSSSKPVVSIVGMGRLGNALAIALSQAGYSIDALVVRSPSRTKKSLPGLDVRPRVLAAKDINELAMTALVIIATPDDEIGNVVGTLCRVPTTGSRKKIALHTSGALSSDVLKPLAARAWSIGSIHPLIAISEPEAGARDLHDAFWCLEGDRRATQVARRIVRDLKGRSFAISADDKPLYHAAAVMASGNLVAVFDVALEMLGSCGINRKVARRILLPLAESAIRNLELADPSQALTGTFARGDVNTVRRHLKALYAKSPGAILDLYRLLGRRSADLATKAGLDKKTLKQIKNVLDE